MSTHVQLFAAKKDTFEGLPESSFTVEFWPHGMVVRSDTGSVPIHSFKALTKMATARKRSWTKMSNGLAIAIGAILVIGSNKSLGEWTKEHDARCREDSNKVRGWRRSTTTGLSSLYLIAQVAPTFPGEPIYRATKPAFPRDRHDFKRCVDAVKWTELRDRLGLAADGDGKWAPFLALWPRMETMLASDDPEILKELDNMLRRLHALAIEEVGSDLVFAQDPDGTKLMVNEKEFFEFAGKVRGSPILPEEEIAMKKAIEEAKNARNR